MNKNLRKLITIVLTTSLISGGLITNVYASNNENIEANINVEFTQLTDEEKAENDNKLKLAEEYAKTKEKARGYGSIKTVSMAPVAQEKGYWCGPATAYCTTNGAASQQTFANKLGTTTSGTGFSSTWTKVLNKYRPGNNYTLMWASSYSDWRAKLKDSIIYTVDKGYPVVANCHITSDPATRIHSAYSYATNTWHYVTVAGYDDRPEIIPAEVLIGDSNTHSGIPRRFWTSLDKLKSATLDRGIVW